MKHFIRSLLLLLLPNLILSYSPQDIDQYTFGKKLYADKMYELAAEQLHDFAVKNPDNPRAADALFLAGQSYFNIANYEQAQKEFLFLILKFPDAKELPSAQFKIAQCFQFMGKLSEAGSAYRQVQIYYPKSELAEQALFLSASMFFQANQYDRAIEILSDFLELFPRSSSYHDAWLLLAESFLKTKNYDRAHGELNKILSATEAGHVNAKASLLKANLFYEEALVNQAEKHYQALIKKYAVSRYSQDREIVQILNEAYSKLSTIFRANGMYETSNEYLTKITNYDSNIEILNLMADNYISMNEYAKALTILQKINTDQNSNLTIFHYQRLGDCYYVLEKFSNAIESYQRVLAICKEDLTEQQNNICLKAYVRISEAYLKLKQPETAIFHLREFRDSKFAEKFRDAIDYQICYIYENEIQDFERAINFYHNFIERYPASKYIDDAQMGLARSYEKAKNGMLALKEYQKLIDRYPASKYYALAQKRIDYINKYFKPNIPAIKNFGEILKGIIESDVEQRRSEQLLYQLALNYFNELKDYATAIDLFDKLELYDKIGKDELWYYKGRAFQLLAQEEATSKSNRNFLDSAATRYNMLLKNYPQSPWADEVRFYLIELQKIFYAGKLDSSLKIKEALTEFIKNNPESDLVDQIYLELACSILGDGNSRLDPSDSLLVYASLQQVLAKNQERHNNIGNALFLKSNLFYRNKNYNQAEEDLNHFISNFPQNPYIAEAYFLQSKISAQKNEYQKAIDLLKQLITIYFYNELADSAKIEIGNYLLKQNKYQEALDFFIERYRELFPTKFEIFKENSIDQSFLHDIIYNIGYAYKMLGKNEDAIKFFQEYLKLFPHGKYNNQVLFFQGELHDVKNNKERQAKAIDYFTQLENGSTSDELVVNSIIKLGDIFFDQENLEQACGYYLKALSLQLSENQRLITSSKAISCLYKMGRISEADDKFKEFKKKYKDEKNMQAKLLLEKGNYFLNNKIFDQAEKIFKEIKSEFKNSVEGIRADYLLGKLYFILNKNEEALELLTNLILKNPESEVIGDIYITLGNFYYLSAKQIENAMFAYKKAIEQKSITEDNLRVAMLNLIKCYADLQQWEKAIAMSREFITRFPSSEDVIEKKIQIAYYYYRLNEYDYAIQLFKQILPEADNDNEPRIKFWIGECYFNKGEFQKAVGEYLKILYISKPAKLLEQYKVTALYQAAISYIKLKKFENAKQLLQRIINEQGAESVFGKSAREKLNDINNMIEDERETKI